MRPARDLDCWLEEIDRAQWFKGSRPSKDNSIDWNPSSEATETTTHYIVKIDLPGVSKELIKIDLRDNCLTVSGERTEEKKEDSENNHFSEMLFGSFVRSFILPTKVDPEISEANYDNGVLTIQIPKTAPTQARQIKVR
jgi:HSP20 family protein